MSKNRRILLIVFIAVSVIGMWARYAHQRNEQRKREELFRRLSLNRPLASEQPSAPAAPVEPKPVDPRPIFDSTLPQETFDLLRQKIGGDFRLMELSFSDTLITYTLSTDGQKVEQYRVDKDTKEVTGPAPVNIIGGGSVAESLFDPKLADLSLIPRLAREAVERAGLPEGHSDRVSFRYPGLRYPGEKPEWTVAVYSGSGESLQSKLVQFDDKGKFKRAF